MTTQAPPPRGTDAQGLLRHPGLPEPDGALDHDRPPPGSCRRLPPLRGAGDRGRRLPGARLRTRAAPEPVAKASPAARAININAVYARYPDPAFFATSVNRAACHNVTKVLAARYGPDGILVNSVDIGFVDTPQWEDIRARRAPGSTREECFGSLAAKEVPLGRFGITDEVSGVVVFLASDRASYVTGAVVDVASGMGR